MASSEYRDALRQTWEAALEDEREVTLGDVANRFISDNGALVVREQQRSFYSMVLRDLKQMARTETEESSQLSLFGFPSVIAIPVMEDGYYYMQTTKAVFDELVRGAAVRVANVTAAQQKLDTYNGALEKVRPLMEGSDKTLAEALQLLGQEVA